MTSLWLLKSKTHTGDTRSEETKTRKYWLRPGVYTIGRPGTTADIIIPEDKSISRIHATLTIPSIHEWTSSEGVPYVDIADSSRYGTLATAKNDLDHEGSVGLTARAFDRWILRFGYDSPFKLLTSPLALYLHPSVPDDLRRAAASLGLPLTDDIERESIIVVMPSTTVPADGVVLYALVHSRPIVAPSWVHAWNERKVWVDRYPLESDHPVSVEYTDILTGTTRTVDAVKALQEAKEKKIWSGLKLSWIDTVTGHPLMRAAEIAGASTSTCPFTKRERLKKVPSDTVVVLKDDSYAMPTGLEGHKRTSLAIILAALFQGLPNLTELSEPSVITSPGATPEDISPGKNRKAAAKGTPGASPTKSPTRSPSKRTQKGVPSEEPNPSVGGPRSKRAREASAQPTPGEQSQETGKKASPGKKVSPRKKARVGPSGALGETPGEAPVISPSISLVRERNDVAWKVVDREQQRKEEERTAQEERKEESAMEEEEEEDTPKRKAADFDAPSPPSASKDASVSMAAPIFAGNVAFEDGIIVVPNKKSLPGTVLGPSGNSPNFKAFKKKGAVHVQQNGAPMQYNPEPYSGQVTEEGEAYLREQRELAHRSKMAEQMFEKTAAGGGKPTKPGARRTTKRS